MKKVVSLILLLIGILSANSLIKSTTQIPLNGKPIIYIFDSKTCPYCEKLKKELNEVDYLNNLATKFDIYSIPRDEHKIYKIFGKSVSTQELQLSYKIKETPNIIILTSKAQKMFQTHGYIPPKALSKMLEFTLGVDSGKYKTSDWAKFLFDSKLTTSKEAKPKTMVH